MHDASHRRPRAAFALLLAATLGCQKDESPVGPGSNRAPEIRNVTVTPAAVPLGGTAGVRVEAVDPDGDPIFYRYQAEVGTITPDPQEPARAVYAHTGTVARGSDRISVTVVDDKNAAASFNVTVDLLANQAPRVEVSAGRSSCHPECTVNVTAAAQDVEGDALDYAWSGCASGSARTATCRLRSLGPSTAVVSVRDARGALAVGTVTVAGVNEPPVVTRDGGEQRPSPARLVIGVHDPDDADVRCAWRGDCTCTGSFRNWDLDCAVPAGAAACSMTAHCWDRWGGAGETRFRLQR